MIPVKILSKNKCLLLQGAAVYAWLTVLSPLSVTDTYYSVYLLCAVFGLFALVHNSVSEGEHLSVSDGKVRKICAFLSVAFSAAVILANYGLFEPLNVLQNLLNVFFAFSGGICIAYPILMWMVRNLPLRIKPGKRHRAGRLFLFVFLSVSLIDLLFLLFACYPGVLTTDSFSTMAQIMGDYPYNNIMPFWHTVTVEVFVDLGLALFGDINAAVALFHGAQILFMALCFAFALMTLYQLGIPRAVLAAVYLVYAVMPYNIVYSVTLWKDIPFAGAALLFITAFYRLLKGFGNSKINYALLVFGGVGFSLWRTNGWYAFLATVLVLWLLLHRSHRRLVMAMLAILIVCWILINPVLTVLDVEETNFVEAFAVPMQQIARVVAQGRSLTAEETAMLSEIFWIDKMAALYDPLTVDPIKFETFRYDKAGYIMEHFTEYLSLYLRIGARYPSDYLKAWIDETKGYWNGGYFFWTYTLKLGENQYGIFQSGADNIVARLYAALFRYIEKPEILQFVISIGLYVWALVSCCAVNVMKKREEFLLTIPLLVLIAGLWLGTPVYSEFRYAYPLILCMPVILCVTCYGADHYAS